MNDSRHDLATPPAHSVVTLLGKSREIYGFTAFPLAAGLRGAGVYIFVRPPAATEASSPSYWTPLYVGGTDSLDECNGRRNAMFAEARRRGATHVLLHYCDRGEDARRHIEADLVAALAPELNHGALEAA